MAQDRTWMVKMKSMEEHRTKRDSDPQVGRLGWEQEDRDLRPPQQQHSVVRCPARSVRSTRRRDGTYGRRSGALCRARNREEQAMSFLIA
jgi:hypothetical protein